MANIDDNTPESITSTPFSLDEANHIINLVSNFPICSTCGTQFHDEDRNKLQSCFICNDPRQYVPQSGQSFTTLAALRNSNHVNKFEILSFPCPPTAENTKQTQTQDDRFYTIQTSPKVGIGQRAFLISTPDGNVLWDCITYLDLNTVSFIQSHGGLAAIVISHPHFYSSHLLWAAVFKCPVYISQEDADWLVPGPEPFGRPGEPPTPVSNLMAAAVVNYRKLLVQAETEIEISGVKSGIKAIKLGGHFPGSLVLLANSHLLIADTLMTTPAGLGDWSGIPSAHIKENQRRPEGMNSYSFMWSIPNMIPLSTKEVDRMWSILQKYEFVSTHGGFAGMEIVDGMGGSGKSVKDRIRESMILQRCAVEGIGKSNSRMSRV